jgi:hypothetical protein
MKKMIAMMVAGGMFAFGAIGCGPSASSPTSSHVGNDVGNKEAKTTTGKITAVSGDSITVKGTDGKEAKFSVPTSVTPTLDGKDVKLSDLKDGQPATVTQKGDLVTKVEAKKE